MASPWPDPRFTLPGGDAGQFLEAFASADPRFLVTRREMLRATVV
jgi:hypothetical protein